MLPGGPGHLVRRPARRCQLRGCASQKAFALPTYLFIGSVRW